MSSTSSAGAGIAIELTQQEPIPPAGVEAALAVMASGQLHRYGEVGAKPSEVSALEEAFAAELGRKYCIAVNSCGSTLYLAMRACGVKPGDKVLSNCFTLAPVPGAIAHAGAVPVLVDVTDDYTIDLADLAYKAASSGAKTLLLSHMRGHICDMQSLSAICAERGIQIIEDCAHTMGAGWDGKATGTWGRAGCFSLQSYKHANAGEGGLLVTDDDDVAAQVILLSGSYMLYRSHVARPADDVFERWKYITPNLSMRMSNLAAAVVRPQLGEMLKERCARWNQRYAWLADGLQNVPNIELPKRQPREQFVASSIQFSLTGLSHDTMQQFIEAAAARGLHIKWFGAEQPVGFTSVWSHWRYFGHEQRLPSAERILAGLCDLRIPLTLTQGQCERITGIILAAMNDVTAAVSPLKEPT